MVCVCIDVGFVVVTAMDFIDASIPLIFEMSVTLQFELEQWDPNELKACVWELFVFNNLLPLASEL